MYAYGLAKSDDKCFVYEFNPRGFTYADYASFNAYYQIDLPKGLDENACFASTPPYSGIIFYASGNTVYRLDFKQAGRKSYCNLYSYRRESYENEICQAEGSRSRRICSL